MDGPGLSTLDRDRALVPDLLSWWAGADASRPALVVGESAIDYASWESRSNAVARGLAAKGVRPGHRVALYFDNVDWLDFAVAYLGVLKAGGVAVPLSSKLGATELRWILDHCEPVGILCGRAEIAGSATGWRTTVAEIKHEDDAEFRIATARPDDLTEVLYTSGTTGRPKGVASTHLHSVRPLLDSPNWYPDEWSACRSGVYVHANSVSTAAGQLRLLEPLGPLGMTTVALPVFDAERFCALIEEHRAAAVQLIPAMALTIRETGAHRRHDLSSLRVMVFGCAPLPPSGAVALAAEFPDTLLVNMYELSEARHVGTYARCGDDTTSVGRPRGASKIRVIRPDGTVQPPGEVGEICVRWPGLAPQSYYRDPDATAAVFGDGWTRTGDGGRLDEAGRLTLVDRLKDIIIAGGHSISSVEVEDAIHQHPAVTEVAVFGRSHPVEGEEVCAAVVLKDATSTDDLRAHVRARLAAHKVPRHIIRLPELPRNRSGKVLKRDLRAQFAAGPEQPVDDIATLIRMVWRQVLAVEPKAGDDFRTLGGDSLRASQIAGRLGPVLDFQLTVAEVFDHPTVEGLAAFVRGKLADGKAEPVAPIRRLPRPPLLSAKEPG